METMFDELLAHVSEEMFEAHRGAFLLHPNMVAIFSNAGHADDTVSNLRQRLCDEGLEVRSTMTTEDGYSFVLLVPNCCDVEAMEDLVWDEWRDRTGDAPEKRLYEQIQRGIALGVISELAPSYEGSGSLLIPA